MFSVIISAACQLEEAYLRSLGNIIRNRDKDQNRNNRPESGLGLYGLGRRGLCSGCNVAGVFQKRGCLILIGAVCGIHPSRLLVVQMTEGSEISADISLKADFSLAFSFAAQVLSRK